MKVSTPTPVLKRPLPRPHASRVLVGLSFCGGGTTPMRPWARAVPDDVEVALLCYPGRESRYSEPFARTWDRLVDDAVAAVSSVVDRPYTLLGHSMGGWVAFDVAVRLDRRGLPGPRALVVSASEPPTRWETRRSRPPYATDTDEQLLRWLGNVGQMPESVVADPELSRIAVEIVRADIEAADTYRYRPGTVIEAPIHILYGADDPDLDRATAAGWAELTLGGHRLTELPGGHFYTPDVWDDLPARVDTEGLPPR